MTDLLLLHAALGAASQFDALAAELRTDFTLRMLDFEGHGAAPPSGRPFAIEAFAENVIDYMDARSIATIDVFGYSMGGYVALYLAATAPERLGRIMTFGTKLRWDPDTSARETKMLDPDRIAQKVPQFAAALEARHSGSGWRKVLADTAEMMIALGRSNPLTDDRFASIRHSVRLGVGDRDVTVSAEETCAVYRLLEHGELQVFPSTPHAFDRVRMPMMASAIREFFAEG